MAITRTTSRDIADRAGVSQATVSRALRDSPLVRPETRNRILKISRELNYLVDRSAAGLRSRQSRTIALLLFEDPTSDDSHINPFFVTMLGSITRAAAVVGYDVLVSFQQLNRHWHELYEASNLADGIILLGYGDYISYGERLNALANANANFIIWGPVVEGQPGHFLGCDNVAGAAEATNHLISAGRRRIAFLGSASEHCPEFAQRFDGYRESLVSAGLDTDAALQFDADSQEGSGYAATRHLLDSGKSFDAVLAASDLIAVGAIRAFRDAGLRVPEEAAVVGFDDIPAASYINPALTTVHQDTALAGQRLVENLLKVIKGEPVTSQLITPKLVVRQSCGAANSPGR